MKRNENEEMKPYLSVVIPAYNEEKRIRSTLDVVYRYLTAQPFSWEMVIALDGPTDGTLSVVQSFAQGKEHVRWLDRKNNRGKGYTLREGMLTARGTVRLFTDADNSTDITHFDRMKPYFEQGMSVVICSRDRKDAPGARQAVPQPFLKRLLGNAGNLFIQLMVVPGIWDTRCGFKAFTGTAAERIFSVTQMDGFSIDDEALALARRFGYNITVIGADWIDAAGTHVTRLDYLRNIWEAVRIRWNLLTGVYNQKPRHAINEKTPTVDVKEV